MTALFKDPIRISIQPGRGYPSNGLLLGIHDYKEHGIVGLVMLEDGTLTHIDSDLFTCDWRYEVAIDRWVDVNIKPEG